MTTEVVYIKYKHYICIMEKEMAPYNLALRMKAIDFDEPCMAYYVEKEFTATDDAKLFLINRNDAIIHNNSTYLSNDIYKGVISAQLFQQAFRWFRDNYNLYHNIDKHGYWFFEIKKDEGFGDLK
jgi:hypothetical protein